MLTNEAMLTTGFTCLYRSPSGGYVYIHRTHGKAEAQQNVPIAKFLAELGERVCLLQVVNAPGAKNPDATRNGVEWEFKTPESSTRNAVDKALRSASKQADRVLLHMHATMDIRELEQAMYARVLRTENLIEVAVLRGRQLFYFNRHEIVNNTFRGKIK